MSIFSKPTEEVVICSAMEGKLTFEGKPATGAKIVRWSAWKDEEGESEVFYADEQGDFDLPIKKSAYKKGAFHFLSQFVAKQLVTVTYQGADYEIWYSNKFEPIENTEYGGAPVNFRCELTDEPKPSKADGILMTVSCKWDLIDEMYNSAMVTETSGLTHDMVRRHNLHTVAFLVVQIAIFTGNQQRFQNFGTRNHTH